MMTTQPLDLSFSRAALLAALVTAGIATNVQAQDDRPNIIHIFADDLAWGSVGFNNAGTYVQTPNLDALAAGGMILDRTYASTVCSPSRANLMTGTHNGHAANDRNGNIGAGLRAQDVTVGEVMNDAGYHTAVIGKWGWGATGTRTIGTGADPLPTLNDLESQPSLQGFNTFYGMMNHGAAHDFYYDWMWESSAIAGPTTTVANDGDNGDPEYNHDLISRRSEQFVRDQAGDPFYLQMNYTIPHFDVDAIDSTPELTDLDGNVIAPAGRGIYANDPNLGDKQEKYAAMITRMDASIGSLVASLDDPNGDGDTSDSVLANTLILFSSDNGATPEDGFGAGNVNDPAISGPLRGGKRDLYEGGIRMPGLAYWPGTIEAGTRTGVINDLADVMATAADLAGTQARVGIDGVSILPALTGEGEQRDRGVFVFENYENNALGNPNTRWTVIRGDDKLIKRSDGVFELYNLATDLSEAAPLDLNVAANAQLKSELEALALAESVEQPDAFATQYRDWTGATTGSVTDSANWAVTDEPGAAAGTPDASWSALLRNPGASAATATATGFVQTLGIEISGVSATQRLEVARGGSIHGRNEIRIGNLGVLELQDATASSVRWIDVLEGGELAGHGQVQGVVYNQGTVSPGVVTPVIGGGDAPGTGGVAVDAVTFNFTGVQDDAPLTATSLLNENIQLVAGFNFGPGTSPRNAADAGDEFNVQGFATGDLAEALANGDYLTFTVAPEAGLAMTLDAVSYNLWRNGVNAAKTYTILTSETGFGVGDELATLTLAESDTSEHLFTATTDVGPVTGALEIRLYGHAANQNAGNTHFNALSLRASFETTPQTDVDVTGRLTLDGDFHQYADAALLIDLGGSDQSNLLDLQHDDLVVTGTATLDGDLTLTLVDGYVPSYGTTHSVVSAGAIIGQFAKVNGVLPESNLALAVTYEGNVVLVTAAIPGDFNLDGEVGLLDLDILGTNWQSGGANWALGDANGDGEVTLLDLDILGANWGTGAAGASGTFAAALADSGIAVPEPATFIVGTLASVALMSRRP